MALLPHYDAVLDFGTHSYVRSMSD